MKSLFYLCTKRGRPLFLLTALALCFPAVTYAGSFNVSPTKIVVNSGKKIEDLFIRNSGDGPLTLQLEAKRWFQDGEGKDRYGETNDIVFFPKIVTIEKGKRRVVRVGYQGKRGGGEKTFRLFLEEIPVTGIGEKSTGLNMLMVVGISVFVPAVQKKEGREIESVKLSGGELSINVINSGNTHISTKLIKAEGVGRSGEKTFSRQTKGWYILPGITGSYKVNVPEEECLKSDVFRVSVGFDGMALEKEFPVNKEMCSPKRQLAAKE